MLYFDVSWSPHVACEPMLGPYHSMGVDHIVVPYLCYRGGGTMWHRLVVLILAVAIGLTIGGCGGDGDSSGSEQPPPPVVVDPPVETEEMEYTPSPAEVSLAGVSETAFNPVAGTVTFEITGGTLSADMRDIHLLHNYEDVPHESMVISEDTISVPSLLVEGRNHLDLLASDSNGYLMALQATLWVGAHTLTVTVLDDEGYEVDGAEVTAVLPEGENVEVTATTVDGEVSFQNVPNRTILITATTSDNEYGSIGVAGGVGHVELELIPFGGHDSQSNTSESTQSVAAGPTVAQDTDESYEVHTLPDFEGKQEDRRSFDVLPGTATFVVNYRFVTAEFPAYYGTEFNDSFSVSIHRDDGRSASVSTTMNNLGSSAFDSFGATDWRSLSLSVAGYEDEVDVYVNVSNVGDGQVQSYVEIVIPGQQGEIGITRLQLHDIDGSPLQYLSADAHDYFGGNTRIHGTITVEGAAGDALRSLQLEVLQGGAEVATARLAGSVQGTLLTAFGADGKVELNTSRLLFELPSGEARQVDGSQDGTVHLRVRAESDNGMTTRDYETAVRVLVRYRGNRFGSDRDLDEGGDDWARPSVVHALDHFETVFSSMGVNDTSNMNGGRFFGHVGHRNGLHADCYVASYGTTAPKGAAAAEAVLTFLNDAVYGNRISRIVVAPFRRDDTSEFWRAIKNDPLQRKIRFANPGTHVTHFHVQMRP